MRQARHRLLDLKPYVRGVTGDGGQDRAIRRPHRDGDRCHAEQKFLAIETIALLADLIELGIEAIAP